MSESALEPVNPHEWSDMLSCDMGSKRSIPLTPSCSQRATHPYLFSQSNSIKQSADHFKMATIVSPGTNTHAEREWVEQDDPGVYITFVKLPSGSKDLRRVRFSRKKFNESQAEKWWAENKLRVYQQHKIGWSGSPL
ncbi:hypothetical protein L7F22_016057 [Adiantum nelumboides]|nr:hypothetical protein [Adiantum nelumboides]